MSSSTITRRTGRRKLPAKLLAILGLAAGAWATTALPAHAAAHRTIAVGPGTGTISAAVAAARPGDSLVLSPGTFYDSEVFSATFS